MRNKFDEQLKLLNKNLIEMGSLCQESISLSALALTEGKPEKCKKVIPITEEIDHMERSIESICLKMLLQQQPVARDLRQISAALKMITDMDRIGVQAADIADIITFLNGRTGEECSYIQHMAKSTIQMVTDSIDAYVKQDLLLAQKVIVDDDIVDDDFTKAKNFLIDMISQNTADGEYAMDLLMIAKYFERIGDHAVNIAEWVQFSVTGVHKGEAEL